MTDPAKEDHEFAVHKMMDELREYVYKDLRIKAVNDWNSKNGRSMASRALGGAAYGSAAYGDTSAAAYISTYKQNTYLFSQQPYTLYNSSLFKIPTMDDVEISYSDLSLKLWCFRFLGFCHTCMGIVFMATIIAFIVDIVREKLDDLKKGKSKVIETNHIIMVGWTDKSISIIKELADANSSEGGVVIVILTLDDKEKVESTIGAFFPRGLMGTLTHSLSLSSSISLSHTHTRAHILTLSLSLSLYLSFSLSGTQLVVRNGSGLQASDLYKINIQYARCIILLANMHTTADSSDASTVQTILSIKSLNIDYLCGYLVCEMRDKDNETLAQIVGGDETESLVAHDIIGRLMVMSSRQPGLSKVYDSVLGFEGDEFYIKEWPELVGQKFEDLLLQFPEAIVFGVKQASDDRIRINPGSEYVIGKGDEIVVIAEDNDTYKPEKAPPLLPGRMPKVKAKDMTPEKVLICGWRRDVRDVIKLLDELLNPGSEVHIICKKTEEERNEEFVNR